MTSRIVKTQETTCDRCGKSELVDISHYYDHDGDHEENMPTYWTSLRGMAAEDLIRDTYLDLCHDCSKSFSNWYKEKIDGKKH